MRMGSYRYSPVPPLLAGAVSGFLAGWLTDSFVVALLIAVAVGLVAGGLTRLLGRRQRVRATARGDERQAAGGGRPSGVA